METVRTSLAGEVFIDDVRMIAPLPPRLRIGVTGHRRLPEDPQLAERVREVMRRIQHVVGDAVAAEHPRGRRLARSASPSPIQVAVVSALAEGADRLVAREILRDRSAVLEAVLPLPERDYIADFTTDSSRAAFNALLARANVIWELPAAPTREEAYEQGGVYVVDRCDVLIALWDGEAAHGRGGTGEVVALARQRRLPVFWIETHAPYAVHEERASSDSVRPLVTLARHYRDYSRSDLNSASVAELAREQTQALATSADRAGIPAGTVEPYGEWIFPYRAVAAGRARLYRRLFYFCGRGLYALSALAVVLIALPTAFPQAFPAATPFVGGEFGCLLLILLLYALERRVHKRWITYRTLAEHLRSELFLCLVGVGDDRRHRVAAGPIESGPVLAARASSDEWLARFLDEVRYRRPALRVNSGWWRELTSLLADSWIGEQATYQLRAQERHERDERRFAYASYATFGVALIVALLHALGVRLAGFALTEGLLLFFALTLPGIFSALKGIQDQGEHQRNAERSRHIRPRLMYQRQRLLFAHDLAGVQAIARETADLLLSENRDWVSVMRYRQPELHV